MRDRRMDRFVILPFSIGCVSQSSVAVCENQPKRGAQTEAAAAAAPSGDSERQSNGKLKNSFTIPPLPRPNISAGFHKLVKSFKSLSQYFVLYREEDEDEEEEEVEMEIGFPTDVEHVAHIGWDGLNSLSSKKSWDKAGSAPEFLSLPSFSLKQFELAMVAQAGGAPPPPRGPHGSWPQ